MTVTHAIHPPAREPLPTERFKEAMRSIGLEPPSEIIADGTLHRFHVRGDKPKTLNGWYILHGDDPPAGQFGSWKSGINETWCSREYRTLTPEEKARYAANMEATRKAREAEQARIHAECRKWCSEAWEKCRDASNEHPYLKRKRVNAYGLKLLRDALMVPVRDMAGTLHGLQFVQANGDKTFKSGTAKEGHFFVIGEMKGDTAVICEGYATAASLYRSTGHMVFVAFDAGNLLSVSEAVRKQYPKANIILAADNDQFTEGNPGLTKATEAAKAVNGKLAVPVFQDAATRGTDFNDLHQTEGLEAVKACIEAAAMVVPPLLEENPPEAEPPKDKPRFCLKSGRELRSLDIKIEWLVEGIIPRGAVILLYGRGGIGKTTLMMMIADAIDRGDTIFGMATTKTQVIVIDFENSLAVLSERAKRTGVEGVLFLDSGQNPPSLDKSDWTAYQELLKQYPGAVFVFDTLRSSHSGDENNSETMTLIMRRMRMLRDAGATPILLHHTPKGNDRQFKGSGAIFDLCDQTLALYQTSKPGSDQEADDDDDAPDKVYRFGTGKKTRYRPHRVFLSFDTEQEVFTLAKNPDDEALEYLHSIVCQIDEKTTAKQSEIVKAAISDGGFDFGGEKKIRALLKRGTDRFWTTDRGLHNSIIYRPIQFGRLADPIGAEKLPDWNNHPCQLGNTPEKQVNNNTPQSHVVVESGRLADTTCQTEEIPFFDLEEEAV